MLETASVGRGKNAEGSAIQRSCARTTLLLCHPTRGDRHWGQSAKSLVLHTGRVEGYLVHGLQRLILV